MHHLFRFFNLDLALRAGHLGARWLADEGFGYGFPVLNFYAPLGYYVGLVFHWLGAGFVTTLELTLAAGLLLAAVAMFLFARELFGPWGAAIAAVAYTWAPYHLADTWMRGALAEQLAFIWIPILLLALLKIARAKERARWGPTLWGGLALAGLILTHNLTVLLVAPVLIAWAIFLMAVEARQEWLRCLGHFVVLGLLGLMLSAAFWLPAIVESKIILAGQSPEGFADWLTRLEPPQFLLAESWRHPYTIQDRRIEHALGQAQVLVALLGLLTGLWRWRRLTRTPRLALPLWVGLLLLALFMQSRWSEAVWRLPGLLLLQFPWRWQTVGAVATALLSGYLVFVFPWAIGKPSTARPSSVRGLVAPSMLVLAVGAALISAALPGILWEPSNIPTTDTPASNNNVNRQSMVLYDYGRGLWLREHGSPWMFEYMPVDALALREEFFLSAGPTEDSSDADALRITEPALAVQMIPGLQRPLERRFTVNSAEPWTLQLHQFYFPGWQAVVDGETVAAQPVGKLALAGVPLPAGQHDIEFRFGATPVRQLGTLLSLAGLLALLAGIVWLRKWWWLAAGGLAILALVAAVMLRAQADPAAVTPQPVAINYDQQVQLLGYHLDDLQPGGASEVALTWLALNRPRTDYKVFLHLVDQNGDLWAQHDGEPGYFFSPTTRWQRGEVIDDRHELIWREDASPPPGRYMLFAGLYDPATGVRLPILDAAGNPASDQALLAEIDVP